MGVEMNEEYELILQCYRSGQMTEAQWQAHLTDYGFRRWIKESQQTAPSAEGQAMIDGPFTLDIDSYEPGFRDIHRPGHPGFMRVVWKMEDDERSPKCEEAALFVLNALNSAWAAQQDADKVDNVEGDLLPPVGTDVLIHLASSDKWVTHTVVGYYVWGDLKGDASLQRVFVRVRDGSGYLNARLLKDVRKPDGTPIIVDRVKPDPAMAGDEWLEEIRQAAIKLARDVFALSPEWEANPTKAKVVTSLKAIHELMETARKRVHPASGNSEVSQMVHSMFRSGNPIPVPRITITRQQYDAVMQQGGQP